jgi:hypothetical protein
MGEAEFAEAVVLFAGEAEANHVAAGFEGHSGEEVGGTLCASKLRNELQALAMLQRCHKKLNRKPARGVPAGKGMKRERQA